MHALISLETAGPVLVAPAAAAEPTRYGIAARLNRSLLQCA